jgi:hypothetical protein
MTASTDWPRIGPAAYRAATREDGLRREANPQLDGHLTTSLQAANSAQRTLSRWRHGFKSRWDYDAEFGFGLDLVLDGIERLVECETGATTRHKRRERSS